MSQFSKNGIELRSMRQPNNFMVASHKNMSELQNRKRSNLAVRNPTASKSKVYNYAPMKGNQ